MRYNQPLCNWNFTLGTYKAKVKLPHTWNVDNEVMRYRGKATYDTAFHIDCSCQDKKVYLKCNAVYHTAKVSVNGRFIGKHSRSGYTPFIMDITDAVEFGKENKIEIEADNMPADEMLPQGENFDWADDGGMIRGAMLMIRETDAIEYLHITEQIDSMEGGYASGTLHLKTNITKPFNVSVYDYAAGVKVAESSSLAVPFEHLKLWSCFEPNLYLVTLETDNDRIEERVGIRKFETKDEKVYLNGNEIFLRGCEWMPGSHPDYGMAEPLEHSIKRLRQLKDAGCVFTRFHWQQDDSLYDWCDENGLLVQEEIPYWGYPKEPTPLQLEIAKQHADEMLRFHFNHPSIVCWGVGNELGGDKPATIAYVRDMVRYFKERDNRRLVNFVSNTLSRVENADKDDATLYGDIVMWNDYLGLWEPSEDIADHILRTCRKAAGRPLVVSEFGLCEPRFQGGDPKRCRILEERIALYEKIPNICGYVWFSLNDYRTHMGEEGEDNLRRRVHGSTDLYGNEKPSYRLLCKLQRGR